MLCQDNYRLYDNHFDIIIVLILRLPSATNSTVYVVASNQSRVSSKTRKQRLCKIHNKSTLFSPLTKFPTFEVFVCGYVYKKYHWEIINNILRPQKCSNMSDCSQHQWHRRWDNEGIIHSVVTASSACIEIVTQCVQNYRKILV